MRVTMIPILVGALYTVPKYWKEIETVGCRRKNWVYPNYSFVEISLNTEKCDGILKRLAVNQSPVKAHWTAWNSAVMTFKLRTNAKLNCLIWNCIRLKLRVMAMKGHSKLLTDLEIKPIFRYRLVSSVVTLAYFCYSCPPPPSVIFSSQPVVRGPKVSHHSCYCVILHCIAQIDKRTLHGVFL